MIRGQGFVFNLGFQVEPHVWRRWRYRLSLWLAGVVFLVGLVLFSLALSQPLTCLHWLPLSVIALAYGEIRGLQHLSKDVFEQTEVR
jgi:hypothetical protein